MPRRKTDRQTDKKTWKDRALKLLRIRGGALVMQYKYNKNEDIYKILQLGFKAFTPLKWVKKMSPLLWKSLATDRRHLCED